MLEAVIFDMDGVIFDSEALVISTWKQVADKYGISGIEDTCMECLGTNSEATVRIFLMLYIKKKWQSFFMNRRQAENCRKKRES